MNIAHVKVEESTLDRIDLTWKAKGIYAWILRHPDCQAIGKMALIERIRGTGKEGVESVKGALKELEDSGLIQWETKIRSATNGQTGKPGYVYVMFEHETGLYKIGSSIEPKRRAMSVANKRKSTISLLKTIPCTDMGASERAFHRKYEYYRRQGEFFDLPEWAVAALQNQEVA